MIKWILPLLLSLLVGHACSGSDCLYTENIIDPTRLISSDELYEKKWVANNHSFFAKTSDGSKLKVEYWACENYSVQAQLSIPKEVNQDELVKKIIWLATYIFSAEDVQVIKQSLNLKDGYPVFLEGKVFEKLMINVSHGTNGYVLIVFGST